MPPLFFLTNPDDIRVPGGSTMSDQHRSIQDALLDLGARKKHFRKHVEAAVGVRFLGAPRIIPDAFSVNAETKSLMVIEVCISYVPGRAKLQKVAAWFAWLGEHGWSARLFYVTERGMVGIDPTNGEYDREQREATMRLMRGGSP